MEGLTALVSTSVVVPTISCVVVFIDCLKYRLTTLLRRCVVIGFIRLVFHSSLSPMICQEGHLLLLSQHLDLLLLLRWHIWVQETKESIALLTLVQGATTILFAEVRQRHLVRVVIVVYLLQGSRISRLVTGLH